MKPHICAGEVYIECMCKHGKSPSECLDNCDILECLDTWDIVVPALHLHKFIHDNKVVFYVYRKVAGK